MPENSCHVLPSERGPSCSRIEQLKGKKFYLIRFFEDIKSHHEEGKCHKRSSTPCKTPLKVSPTPTKYAASISVTGILRTGKLVQKEPPKRLRILTSLPCNGSQRKPEDFMVKKNNSEEGSFEMRSRQQT